MAVFGGVTTTVPPPSAAAKAKLSSRVQVIARLRHPNLVRMLPLPGGAGLVPVTNDSRRLSDFTLPSATFKRFDLEQVVRLMLDVLGGLSALHEAVVDGERFVHGDLCPEHIYVGEHGTAKLVPITSWHSRSSVKHEPNGYVAPELLRGEPADLRADLFSVGVMLWEAVAGRRMFPDSRAQSVIAALTEHKLPKLTVPTRLIWAAPLCAIVERAIALDPTSRPATAVELSNAIAKAVGKHLAKVGGDTWQDEAPTPVFQARLHMPQLRSTTPPATVIDIDAEVTRRAVTRGQPPQSAPLSPAPSLAVDPAPEAADAHEMRGVRPPAGWLRASSLALGAVAITALAWVVYTRPAIYRSQAAQPVAATALPTPVAPPAAPPQPVQAMAPADPAPAASAPASAGSPLTTAPSVATSVSAPNEARTRPASRAKPKPQPARVPASDYGI